MRSTAGLLLAILVLLALGSAPGGLSADEPDRLEDMRFDRYYDVQALTDALRRIHRAFPDHTRLESMGRSREGRELWVLSVFDPRVGDPDGKPAFYVDGNTHGNEVQGAEVCLYLARYLLMKPDRWVRDLLEQVTFHIAPCINPDGRHRFFATPQDPHSPRPVLRPYDDDRDGRVDEDGPEDLDGDGHILRMRVRDPNGDMVVDERDDRLMRPRKPGEQGQFRVLGSEGIDNDDDGHINEDPEGGVDPNRNWPGHWRPDATQRGAGPYPLSEPETRATALWILKHPRIAGVQSFHNAGRMILRPPAAFHEREVHTPAGDRALYEEIQRRGLYALPTYRALAIRDELYLVYGGFVDWTWFDLGIFSFSNELWGHLEAIRPEVPPGNDGRLEALEWNDVVLHGEGFVRWHEVKHPQYGTVELGGWKRFTVRNNPTDFLHETCARNALFVLDHAASLPQLEVVEARPLAGGVVRLVLANRGTLPTIAEMARRHEVLPPDALRVTDGTLAAATRVLPGGHREVLPLRAGVARVETGLAGRQSETFELLVRGTKVTIAYESKLGGSVRTTVELAP